MSVSQGPFLYRSDRLRNFIRALIVQAFSADQHGGENRLIERLQVQDWRRQWDPRHCRRRTLR